MTRPDPADLRERQRRHWNAVAPGWADWTGWTERNFAPITEWLAAHAGWRRGAHVLDVASGSGYPALTAATHVAPGGSVVAVDLAPDMRDALTQLARLRGIDNIVCHAMDAEALELDDASFDGVSNTYGLMFCPDVGRALSEVYRVLRPHGHAAFVTWAPRSASPFFEAIAPVAAAHLSLSSPPADAPGPFRLSSPDELETLASSAGFRNIRVTSIVTPFDCGSVDDYCRMFTDLAWKTRIATLAEPQRAAFLADAARAVAPYTVKGRIILAATSLCASAVK